MLLPPILSASILSDPYRHLICMHYTCPLHITLYLQIYMPHLNCKYLACMFWHVKTYMHYICSHVYFALCSWVTLTSTMRFGSKYLRKKLKKWLNFGRFWGIFKCTRFSFSRTVLVQRPQISYTYENLVHFGNPDFSLEHETANTHIEKN